MYKRQHIHVSRICGIGYIYVFKTSSRLRKNCYIASIQGKKCHDDLSASCARACIMIDDKSHPDVCERLSRWSLHTEAGRERERERDGFIINDLPINRSCFEFFLLFLLFNVLRVSDK